MPDGTSRTEKAANSAIFTLIARGAMVALLPVSLWVATQLSDWLKRYSDAQTDKFKEVTQKLQEVSNNTNTLQTQLNTTNTNVSTINTTIAEGLRQTLESQGRRLENVERRQDNLQERFDAERDRVTGLVGDVKMLTELSKIKSPKEQ